jgi:ABC-2 type transport system permease protein
VAVLTFVLLYRFTSGIAGWSAAQALVLVGIYRALDGLLALQIAPNLMRISEYVGQGDLDFILLRPVASQFLVSLRWLRPAEAVNVLIGLALVAYAASRTGVTWTLAGTAMALVLAACGFALLYCLWFAIATCAFWLVKVEPLGYLFYDVWQTGRYPVDYFKGIARALLTFALPVAFATTFPARALRGDVDPRLVPLGIVFAALALVATHRFWSYALRHYASASS